ncbi:diacylglycerol O-acyltransferase 1 [Steccherinum ochraceum]|uniref:Diacylglycerol O-acyltransferase n=1 Tax=Steccherinum ochraceum TaxID=92696 RepID=A0A4R0RJU3_9APHY|nr:diacylglycerol O-acyltransferase 1 [Steccherinum ochraceum]
MSLEARRAFTSASRTLSASSLRERLVSLKNAPLKPVAQLHANIGFVPSKIPRKRRMQTMAVAIWSTTIINGMVIFLFLCSFPPLWPLLALYYTWMTFDKSPERGGRFNPWVRHLGFWKYFADYYPSSFLKTCDLPPDRPYVFGYHPHGIIGMGAICTFATESTGFSKAFPGIVPHLLTLSSNFTIPFYRDVLLALGICSAITIVVGGAAESLAAHPGTADLTLRKRLGFIKVAIQHGADLVPVFSFGENDIYDQMPNDKGTSVYTLQKKFQNMFGFTLPLFHGRGLLNCAFLFPLLPDNLALRLPTLAGRLEMPADNLKLTLAVLAVLFTDSLGMMPYRRRIVTVTVEQCDKPTLDEVVRVQEQYIEELMRIWNTHKDDFARSRRRELSIIE